MGTNKTYSSRVYRLTKPYSVEEVVVERELKPGEVAVRPTLGSICHADLRYFTGNRRPESLAKKLPMALIHEGIGEVVGSASPNVAPGTRVVVIPNIPGFAADGEDVVAERLRTESILEDNYSARGRFLGSGTDGLAQSVVVVPWFCVVPIPDGVPPEIAVLTELSTIGRQALRRVESLLPAASVAVFGDGPVGYLTAALANRLYRVDGERLLAFGAVPEKLAQFDFARRELVTAFDFAQGEKVDIAIECTGGKFSSAAINQAIDLLKPGGHLILLGVTEELVPINTRDILEKGITVFGSSRSSFRDYAPVIEAMKDPEYQRTLRKLLPNAITPVRGAADFAEAMKHASEHPHWKKVFLSFEW